MSDLEASLAQVRAHLTSLALPLPDEEDLPPEHMWAYRQPNRQMIDDYFRRLSIYPLGDDSFLIRDGAGQELGRWSLEHIGPVLKMLTEFNAIAPGGATYVMLNSNLLLRQWELNVAHFSKSAIGKRIDDLPNKAKVSTSKGASAPGNRTAEVADLIKKIDI